MSSISILSPIEIEHKIKRIAYQIYETFADEKEIVIAGINGNGYIIAEKIAKIFSEISPVTVLLCEIKMDKKNRTKPLSASLTEAEYKNKAVLLVDDVLHSGTTLIYGVKFFLDTPIKKLKTAVLVNRNHKKFPIKADFKGISLSTSLKEHVQVSFDDSDFGVYL